MFSYFSISDCVLLIYYIQIRGSWSLILPILCMHCSNLYMYCMHTFDDIHDILSTVFKYSTTAKLSRWLNEPNYCIHLYIKCSYNFTFCLFVHFETNKQVVWLFYTWSRARSASCASCCRFFTAEQVLMRRTIAGEQSRGSWLSSAFSLSSSSRAW